MIRHRTLAIVALTVLVGVSRAAARPPKPQIGELPDGILYYEPVAMMSSAAAANQAAGAGADKVQLSFETLGRQFDLTLEPHSPFAQGATVRWVSDTGVVVEPAASDGPFFRGRVEGDPKSWVRLTLHGDALAGIVATGDEVYFLEPATNLFRDAQTADTVAYRLSDTDAEWSPGTCAARAPSAQLKHRLSKLRAARRTLHAVIGDAATTLAATGSGLKEADIALVADYEYYTRHGVNTVSDLTTVLNGVDGIYQAELGVSMQLLTVVVYTTENDPFSSTTNPNNLLPEFSTWKTNNDDNPTQLVWGADLTHLVTGRDLDQNVIGIAYIGGLCNAANGVGVDQDFSSAVSMMSLLLSHEMGHNFGAWHDAQAGSPCESAPPTFIMNPVISSSLLRQFSPCSKSYINPVINGASCLSDLSAPPPGPPVLDPIAQPFVVGGTLTLTGSNFTPGSVLKLFIATAMGTVARGPYSPTTWRSNSLTFSPLDPSIPLGRGFATAMIINTDQGFTASKARGQYLYGSPSANIPTITAIAGVNLRPFDATIPLASVETVVGQGQTVTISGTGFNSPLVNLFTASGNKGPLTPLAGGTSTQIRVTIPSDTPTGPGSFQVVNSPYRGNVISNAVSVPIGALVTISGVTQVGSTVTVRGTGFSVMSVINFYNGSGNLGGLSGTGPNIPLTVDSDHQFHFTVPANAVTGPAFVEVLNPPFIPFSSSGTDPAGGFWLTAN